MFTADASHLTTAGPEALITRTFNFYETHGQPFEWKTSDHDRGDLASMLVQHGAEPEPHEALVLGEASALTGDAPLPWASRSGT